MLDPLRPRLYRPYFKTRVVGGVVISAMGGLAAVSTWLGITHPEAIEAAPKGMPIPIWFALQAFVLGISAWVVVLLASGSNSVEITQSGIIKREPLFQPKRIPLAAVTGFVEQGSGWSAIPTLLWRDGTRIRKFPVPMFRAEDGTLLREVAPALAETLVRLPASGCVYPGIRPENPEPLGCASIRG